MHDRYWVNIPARIIRGRWHGYRMKLDLADWSDRITYFLGRYCQVDIQLLLNHTLRPGERFVDVGANNGMVALHGASLVGASGLVEAIEPNPSCCDRIREQIQLNAISHLHVHQCALSDEAGPCELKTVAGHTGFITLRAMADDDRRVYSKTIDVQALRADDILREDPRTVSVIKIDVEGYECHVLRGFKQTIEKDRPILVSEVSRYCLERADSSAEALFAIMAGYGYRGFRISHAIRNRRYVLVLRPADTVEETPDCDVAWIHPEDPRMRSLAHFVLQGCQRASRAA